MIRQSLEIPIFFKNVIPIYKVAQNYMSQTLKSPLGPYEARIRTTREPSEFLFETRKGYFEHCIFFCNRILKFQI
jgi:hypothetical protein